MRMQMMAVVVLCLSGGVAVAQGAAQAASGAGPAAAPAVPGSASSKIFEVASVRKSPPPSMTVRFDPVVWTEWDGSPALVDRP